MKKLNLLMAAAACTFAAGAVSAQDHPVDSQKNIAAETERPRTVEDNQEAKLEQQRDASGALNSTGSASSSQSMGSNASAGAMNSGGAMAGATAGADMSAGSTSMGSTSMGSSTAMGTSTTGNLYSSTTAAPSTRTVTNGPVADTPENRARYGQPMSRAGKRTAARAN